LKAIILAAGQGTRLRPFTDDRPKCLVELAGRPLLDHQLETLRAAGIKDIHIVAGYRADQVVRSGVNRLINERYATTNMVTTLFTAEELMTGDEDLIISYGDIVYETRILKALLACTAPVCLTVDSSWQQYWAMRMDDPLTDAETLKLVDGDRIVELGKKPNSYDDIQGQYMGLIKIRADHVQKLADVWHRLDTSATYDGKDFDNMYMTSFIQTLIDKGWDVRAARIDNGWLEIDEPGDLELADRGIWNPAQ